VPSEVATFRLRFTHHLGFSSAMMESLAQHTDEQARIGVTAKYFFTDPESGVLQSEVSDRAADPGYIVAAERRAKMTDGGFYYERGELYLRIKCRRAFNLESAYRTYRDHELPTSAFPQTAIDQSRKSYPLVTSLRPLVLTPSFQYGTIDGANEAGFRSALVNNDYVAKDILIHCLPGVELTCPFYVAFPTFTIKIGSAGDDNGTSDLFYDIPADRISPSSGAVALPSEGGSFYFIRRDDLLEAGRFPRFQEVRDRLTFREPDGQCLFITHDWQDTDHPDPQNHQYRELLALLRSRGAFFHSEHVSYSIGSRTFLHHEPVRREWVPAESFAYIWYDYSCMPQKPRDEPDELLFREQLFNLNRIFRQGIRTVRVGDKERQKGRSWCVLEQEIAKRNSGIDTDIETDIPPGVMFAVDGADQIFEILVRSPLRGTSTTDVDDISVIEWMLYKNVTESMSKQIYRIGSG
jgi:hypothetical protein